MTFNVSAALEETPEYNIASAALRSHDRQKESSPERPPLDIFGDTTLAGSPELPTGVLPAVVETFARDEAERMGVDPAMIALPCLGVTAASIHDGCQVQPKMKETRWRESARLWIAVIHDPGEKYTPAQAAASEPRTAIEELGHAAAKEQLEQCKIAELLDHRRREEDTKKRAKGAMLDQPSRPVPPRIRRRLVDDITIEAVSDALMDNENGVLATRDELAGWFASVDAYRGKGGGKDRANWLDADNGGARLLGRVSRGRDGLVVPNWSVRIVGGIQPGPMRRLAGQGTDDGLVQRFIPVLARPGGPGSDREPTREALKAYPAAIARLVQMVPDDGAPVVFRLAAAAHRERALVTETAGNVKGLPDTSAAFKAHLSTWDGRFARLLITFHLMDIVAPSPGEFPIVSGGETAAKVAHF